MKGGTLSETTLQAIVLDASTCHVCARWINCCREFGRLSEEISHLNIFWKVTTTICEYAKEIILRVFLTLGTLNCAVQAWLAS